MNRTSSRRGIALLFLVMFLTIISVLLGSVSMQILVNRRVVEQRQNQLQATWLARSGLEVATARLRTDKKYTGETLELLPDSQVRVQVDATKDKGTSITSEGKYRVSTPHPVAVELLWVETPILTK